MITATDKLPSEPDAQRLIVGSICLKASIIAEALAFGLRPSHFTDGYWRRIYGVLVERHLGGQPSDVTIISRELRDDPLFQSVAGGVVVMLIEAGKDAVTSAHWKYHAERIVDAAAERDLRRAVEQELEGLRQPNASGREGIVNLSAALFDLQRDYCRVEDDREQVFEGWAQSVVDREKPDLFLWAPYGSGMGRLTIGRRQVLVAGAPPGAGKTILAAQIAFDALRTDGQENLRLLFANVEMGPRELLDRQLARLTGIGHNYIQFRDFDPAAAPRIQAGIEELRELMPRVEFMSPPFTLERLTERANAFDADVVVCDYAQRFDYANRSSDQRAQCNAVMDCCRRLADQDRAVVVICAVNRSGYGREANLSSFRESSELEYGADDAYLLVRDGEDHNAVTLKCVKNRHGVVGDIPLRFDGAKQQFMDDPAETEWNPV